MLVADFTASETRGYVCKVSWRKGRARGRRHALSRRESEQSYRMCLSLGVSPRLDQACMRVNASYYGSREVVAG